MTTTIGAIIERLNAHPLFIPVLQWGILAHDAIGEPEKPVKTMHELIRWLRTLPPSTVVTHCIVRTEDEQKFHFLMDFGVEETLDSQYKMF